SSAPAAERAFGNAAAIGSGTIASSTAGATRKPRKMNGGCATTPATSGFPAPPAGTVAAPPANAPRAEPDAEEDRQHGRAAHEDQDCFGYGYWSNSDVSAA